jgi:hypothetical protein
VTVAGVDDSAADGKIYTIVTAPAKTTTPGTATSTADVGRSISTTTAPASLPSRRSAS